MKKKYDVKLWLFYMFISCLAAAMNPEAVTSKEHELELTTNIFGTFSFVFGVLLLYKLREWWKS